MFYRLDDLSFKVWPLKRETSYSRNLVLFKHFISKIHSLSFGFARRITRIDPLLEVKKIIRLTFYIARAVKS